MSKPATLIHQLNQASMPYQDPLEKVDWASLSLDEFWLPEKTLSLYGTKAYQTLTEIQKLRLSQYEFIHFLQAGLWVEALLIQKIGQNLDKSPLNELYVYRLHELREETGHSLMFLKCIQDSKLNLPKTAFTSHLWAYRLASLAPFESSAFWLAIWLGEEISNEINKVIQLEKSHMNKAVYQISLLHMIDEARHIKAAQHISKKNIENMLSINRFILTTIINIALKQFLMRFYYPQKHLYTLAGLPSTLDWIKVAQHNPLRKQFVNNSLYPMQNTLKNMGLALYNF